MDENVVDKWMSFNPVRWIAGILTGLLAGLVAVIVAMGVATILGYEIWFPLKYAALPLIGSEAMEFGVHLKSLIAGAIVIALITSFYGFIFGVFVYAKSFWSLFGMGVTWGLFAWIFLNNLYSASVREIFAIQFSSWWALLICMAYGLSHIALARIDKAFRGKTVIY